MSRRTGWSRIAVVMAVVLAALLLALAGLWAANTRGERPIDEPSPAFVATAERVERGAYLALAGNCAACHTARGGAPYAGGQAIDTPFGAVYASNLTPDRDTGLGDWSPAHFWRAMHHGRSKDGRLLYPAFPYPNYTQVTREDSDAIFAYLRTVPAVKQANRPHELRAPYNSQLALAVWRALFFKPATFEADTTQSAQWNRGAYLVRGLGHCNACHASRNAFGATSEDLELSGGLIPMQNWYAPSLSDAAEASVADWAVADVVQLLKTGVSERGSVMGPMAEVVYRSTQHLHEDDLAAMAVFLKALPQSPAVATIEGAPADERVMTQGARLYGQHCAQCHGDQGEGVAGIYPALAGNRAVTMASPANLVRVVLSGGYLPATQGNPRPFGMPPFAQVFSDAEMATVITFIRGSWQNKASPVSPLAVLRHRQGKGD